MMILLMMFLIMIKGPGYQIELHKGALHQARSSTHPNTTLHGTVVVVYRHVRAPGPCNGQISRNLLCVELQTWKNLRFMVCSACFPTKNLPSPNACARGFSWFFSTFLPHFCHLFPDSKGFPMFSPRQKRHRASEALAADMACCRPPGMASDKLQPLTCEASAVKRWEKCQEKWHEVMKLLRFVLVLTMFFKWFLLLMSIL